MMNTQLVDVVVQIIQTMAPAERQLLDRKLNFQNVSASAQEDVHRLNAEKWLLAFDNWLNGHHYLQLPSLSDDDISRESIYGERG
jgi:hypothetical protein